MTTKRFSLALLALIVWLSESHGVFAETFHVQEDEEQITIETNELKAAIRKRGYVSGVAGGSFVDKKTGVRDLGFGLDIVDWIMEPGSDASYRDQLSDEMVYRVNNAYHGKQLKRSIEGPQICTKARELEPEIIRGDDFFAVRMSFRYRTAAPGKKIGSKWTQTIVFPQGERYFISSDRIDAVNSSEAMFLRIDLPGHIKHNQGDTFSQIYLSYYDETNLPGKHPNGIISSSAFLENFAPDDDLNYRRERVDSPPKRFIRAYRIHDKVTGKDGPWLAGMTLDPAVVHEAWCHQRGYVCMIEEFGGRPIKASESFSAAFIVGYFDTIDEMHLVYDRYLGKTGLKIDASGWQLTE